jgi:hypothetical protein
LESEVNPSEVSERLDAPKAEASLPELSLPAEGSPAAVVSTSSLYPPLLSPAASLLRLAYALEFLVALIAIISLWSEVGGEGHLDLMPWYAKLGCILGLAWCSMRFTAGIVEQQKVWTRRTVSWFAGILLFCIAMGGITYYYHLHEDPDDEDQNNTAPAVNISNLGTFFYHASKRTWPSSPVCFLERAAVPARHRISVGSYAGDPRLRV